MTASELTSRILGLIWLLLTVAFSVAALGCLLNAEFWPRLTQVLALTSILMCLLEGADAVVGLIVNLAILGGVTLAMWAGWPLSD